jgi:hypothetical protein
MLNNMSEVQRLVLQAAAAREDRLLQPRAGGAAAKAIASKLMGAGWAREVKAPKHGPIWRRDAANGGSYALKVTAKGLKAVGEFVEKPSGATSEKPVTEAPSRRREPSPADIVARSNDDPRDGATTASARAPRGGSKLDRVIRMLSAAAGATMADLMSATGWLEHSTRAALTGLRRRGYELRLTRGERGGASVYRIAAQNGEATK